MFERNIDKRKGLIRPYIEGKEVLDLGPGDISSGRFLHRFIDQHASNVLGLEIDEDRANNLREKGYNIKIGDAQNFDLNREFDAIVAGDLIEHLTNFEGFFNCVKEHLKEDGKLILNTPNAFGLYVLLGLNRPAFPEHTCWFDEVTLKQILDRFNLIIKETFYYSNYYGTIKGKLMEAIFNLKSNWNTNILVIAEEI